MFDKHLIDADTKIYYDIIISNLKPFTQYIMGIDTQQ